MASIDLSESLPSAGSGQAAKAINKGEQDTIMGRVRETWRRLIHPVSGTDQTLPGRVSLSIGFEH